MSNEGLAERRRKGLDRWDEMWEGVLHMRPAPTYEHQRIVDALVEFLGPLLRSSGRGTLRSAISVFRDRVTKDDYRIPDLTFIARGRESIIAVDGIRDGAPDAVLEIRSLDDQTDEKLPFFAALGVPEVIVVDGDLKNIEIYRLGRESPRDAGDAVRALDLAKENRPQSRNGDATKAPGAPQYVSIQADGERWLISQRLEVGFRHADGPALQIEDRRTRSSRTVI